MAQFSQGFLSSLGRPEMSQSLFGLGAAIGGVPGQMKQRQKEQEQLKRYDQISQMSQQGIASAQSGDVTGLTSRLEQLQQAKTAAKTLEEKKSIGQMILKLQGLKPGAEKVAIGNNARELVNITEALTKTSLTSPARLALEEKRQKLMQDPRAVQQFHEYQMSQWNFEQKAEDIKAEQWLETNRGAILEAVQSGDTKALSGIIGDAGEYVEAAQRFADSSLKSAETMAKFEENSIERKMAPSVDYYTEQVNNLPEEISKNLKATLNAYKTVSEKGWDGSQWTTGFRTRAKQLERELKGQLSSINNQVATAKYAEARREDRVLKERIKKLELKIDAPMSSDYIRQGRIMAQSLLKEDEELTESAITEQATALYERDRRRNIQELAFLTGEKPVEEGEKYEPWQLEIIEEAMNDNPDKSRQAVINALKKGGILSVKPEPAELTEREKRMEALETRDERMEAIGTGLVARTGALGPREKRIKALGPREERTSSLFN